GLRRHRGALRSGGRGAARRTRGRGRSRAVATGGLAVPRSGRRQLPVPPLAPPRRGVWPAPPRGPNAPARAVRARRRSRRRRGPGPSLVGGARWLGGGMGLARRRGPAGDATRGPYSAPRRRTAAGRAL